MTERLKIALAARAYGYYPHAPATLTDGRQVELISYAFPTEHGLQIMARTTPGNPMTITRIDLPPEIEDLVRLGAS